MSGEDAIDLEEPAGVRVAERWFEVPEIEAFCVHDGRHLREKLFAFIEGKERHLQLHGRGKSKRVGRSAEDLRFIALNVELEKDIAGLGVFGEYVVEATHGDSLSLDVLRLRSSGEVGIQHGEDGTGERVGGDVDLDFAGGRTEGQGVGAGQERITRTG